MSAVSPLDAGFACPLCEQDLTPAPTGRALRCPAGHSFDVARQGYVALNTNPKAAGDTADMVRARVRFLNRGHYVPIADALLDAVRRYAPPHPYLADLGGGPGWYAGYLLDNVPALTGVLLDVSAAAARVAARAHPRLSVATADLWRSVPLRTASADVALVVFAPRNPAEIARILSPGGVCLVVTPLPGHLAELRAHQPLLSIEPDKTDRLTRQFADFEMMGTTELTYSATLSADDVADVIAMGPTAFHLPAGGLPPPEPATVTVAVALHCFRTPVR